jgi:hypothetical protein
MYAWNFHAAAGKAVRRVSHRRQFCCVQEDETFRKVAPAGPTMYCGQCKLTKRKEERLASKAA